MKNLTAVRKFLREVSGGAPVFDTLNSLDLNIPVAITATSDGLTTGIVAAGTVFIEITAASANDIVAIPAPTAIGQRIRGHVGTNGCELRGAVGAALFINDVAVSITNEAAIPADTYFELDAISLVKYVLHCRTKLGAVVTAIVPDAV